MQRARPKSDREMMERTGMEGLTQSNDGNRHHRPGSPEKVSSNLSPHGAGTAASHE